MKIVHSLLMLLAAFLIAAPSVHAAKGSVPIQNHEDQPITSADGKPLTAEQVRKAIVSGAATRQWVASVQPGNIVRLTHNVRTHTAVVDVAYSPKSYSIRYADSTNLGYSPEDGKGIIHPNYNKWVNTLRQAIEVALRTV